jgi:hypothetical protein
VIGRDPSGPANEVDNFLPKNLMILNFKFDFDPIKAVDLNINVLIVARQGSAPFAPKMGCGGSFKRRPSPFGMQFSKPTSQRLHRRWKQPTSQDFKTFREEC